jgi:hypothetical protein
MIISHKVKSIVQKVRTEFREIDIEENLLVTLMPIV